MHGTQRPHDQRPGGRTAPEVSVVVPTRDRWSFLSLALECALSQEGVAVEVIVVDDGSSDGTAERAAAVGDARVRVLRHEARRGVAAARNTGIRAAGAPWVAFLDDDDLWSPDKLRAQLDAAEAAAADFAYAAAVLIDRHGEVLGSETPPAPDDLLHRLLALNVMPAGSSNVIVRAELLRDLGGFDPVFAHLDDWDLWIRLAACARGVACPEPLVAYRQHAGNRLLVEGDGLLAEFERLVAKHAELCAGHGVAPDRVVFARWLVWPYRRSGQRFRAARRYLHYGSRERDIGMLARAAGVLAGERVMALGRGRASGPPPDWLRRYTARRPTNSTS